MKTTGYSEITYEAGEAVKADVGDIACLEADAGIVKGTFVKLVTNGHVSAQNAAVTGPVGIALQNIAAGAKGRILISGVGTVASDAAGVTVNDFIKPDAEGKAAKAVYGTDDITAFCLNCSGENGVAVIRLAAVPKISGGE